jgi:DNA-binding response OmpR family regulator
MLTAKGQEEDVVEGLELGADDYVTKPFSIRELMARAKSLLRRHSGDEMKTVQIGDAEFDLVSHKLTRHGTEVPLTTKEYRLLEYFVSRSNRALTRGDIIDHVWGRATIVNSRSVDRCITTLRGKIEPDPRQPTFIQTIRDVGYRFELRE